MKTTAVLCSLCCLLTYAALVRSEAKVPNVVSIWKVDMIMVTTTTAEPTEETTVNSGEDVRHIPRVDEQDAREMEHIYTPKCTGTIISKDFVLTTVECANETANEMGIQVSAGVARLDEANITSKFHSVSQVFRNPPLALLKVKTSFTQKPMSWRKSATPVNTECSFTYWNSRKMIQHPLEPLDIIECPDDDLGVRLCAGIPTLLQQTTRICDQGADGAVLVCNDELSGMWGGDYGCDQFYFHEVQQKKDWIVEIVGSGAGTIASVAWVMALSLVAAASSRVC